MRLSFCRKISQARFSSVNTQKTQNGKERKVKQIFSSIFAYMFDSVENPKYANAAHIKIVKDTDERYPNNLIIVAMDEAKNIDAMFSFEAQKALEPFEAIHDDDCECDLCVSHCPNCADQTSIAAPGETVLCKTHSDEKHFAEMNEFFNDEIERIWFKPHTPFCSACGTEKHVVYVGIINTENSGPLVWSFCGDCRDKLTLKRNAASVASERIGA